ncbi:MAG: hypothetical protein K6U08_00050 [Firmicutes bacterium]|nr:hypothetical protein [Bacillota bacterium]
MRPVRAILAAKWRMGLRQNPGQGILVALFGAVIFLFVFFFARQAFRAAASLSPALAVSILTVLLTFLAVLVFLGALATAFASLHASSDLGLLGVWPLRSREVVTIKLAEVGATSVGVALVLGLPLLLAFGLSLRASPWFYVAVPLLLTAFLSLPTGLGVLTNVLVMRLVPARWARELPLAVSILGGALSIAVFQLMPAAVERIGLAAVIESAHRLALPALPTAWLGSACAGAAWGDGLGFAMGLGAYLAFGGALAAAAVAVTPRMMWSAEESGGRRRRRSPRARQAADVSTGTRASVWGHPVTAIAFKELAVVLRSPTELAQAAYGAVMVFVMFLSRRLSSAGGTPIPMSPGLLAATALLTVFWMNTVVGLGAVGREGRAHWLPLTGPLPFRAWLAGKVLASWLLTTPVGAVTVLVMGLGPEGVAWPELLVVLLCVAAASWGSAAIAVWAGATDPLFEAADPRVRAGTAARMANFLFHAAYMFPVAGSLSLGFHLVARAGSAVGAFTAVLLTGLVSFIAHRLTMSDAANAQARWEDATPGARAGGGAR